MKLPKRVKVGGFSYRVKWAKPLIDGDGRQLSGSIRYHSLLIEIDPDAPAQRHRETLLHEVVHAVINDRGLDQDETFVHEFTKGFAAALVDNPKLARLFLPEDAER